ncbi:transposase [Pseudoalteromonas shioyasakiensis]|uniref:REP-associated tyrosine transposase n=1 Tax=Pseudoalteromonas shioyasakiensis TaxID=1190813 RepID=UPI002118D067|nr:transposase [Pseudoalteromonas shioyasakiensis]MCQ8879446.1 transposase [Pseudoalteromonas shioyasakiensis]
MKPHSYKLRQHRYSNINHYYSVTACTFNRIKLFEDFCNARILINSLKHSDLNGLSKTVCFVIMPDHMHWLFQLKTKSSLSSVVGKVKGRASFLINKTKKEQIWQAGFYDSLIRNEEHLMRQARYIAANPLRAGIVDELRKYPHWDCIYLN